MLRVRDIMGLFAGIKLKIGNARELVFFGDGAWERHPFLLRFARQSVSKNRCYCH